MTDEHIGVIYTIYIESELRQNSTEFLSLRQDMHPLLTP
jgi:hypothetical protein